MTEKAWMEARADINRPSSSAGAASAAAGEALSHTGKADAVGASAEPEESGKLSWQQQKEAQARARKLQNDLKKTEDEIHRLETRDQELDGLLSLEENYSDAAKLMELNDEKQQIAGRLETLYAQWEELAEQIE